LAHPQTASTLLGLADRLRAIGLQSWIRGLFSPARDDEAAEREEYGTPDSGERDLMGDRLRGRYGGGAADAAEADLESFEPPRDANP
jgi:hypothetical protein